jgi:hypothetical protein
MTHKFYVASEGKLDEPVGRGRRYKATGQVHAVESTNNSGESICGKPVPHHWPYWDWEGDLPGADRCGACVKRFGARDLSRRPFSSS